MRIGIIGGSGIGDRLAARLMAGGMETVRHVVETPWGPPSDAVITGRWEGVHGGGVDVALLSRHGVGHVFPPHQVPYRANIWALKSLGVTHLLATGAVGSLRESIRPGDLVLCDQFIDRTDGRVRTFFDHGAVHVEFADPCCGVMRRWLGDAARGLAGTTVHERGVQVVIQGPSFSTRAEASMHRAWGADVVGMKALPEARLAREAEMAYALVALPTDDDCWRERGGVADVDSLLAEIRANLARASDAAYALIEAALADASVLASTLSAAHDALAHAIWSDRARMDRGEIERLGLLWGRCFD
ncbi:MAG: MTAP family purine nucleoside phosphorylase [Phycisphaerales bacterium]|nr:MTAP family purine nucleoside phosphorylase [Phycisphaerales bacterium]